MSFVQFLKLIQKNWKLLLLVPVVLAGAIYYFTRHEKKIYSSETVIYTGIASGYSISGSKSADYYATSNAFDNLLTLINSRETQQEVAISLLASHLFIPKCQTSLLSNDSYDQLLKIIPEKLRHQLRKGSMEETKDAITAYMQSTDANLIYKLINSDNPFYSVNSLKNIKSLRINSSDLIKITYETEDAAVCKHTLELLIEIFMKKHRLLREGQTSSVIAYFEREMAKAFKRLDSCEEIFLIFNKQNDIINYYEQTKAVAGEKENLYSLNHSLEMERNASEKAVNKVNDDIKGKMYQTLYGSDIVKQREQLSGVYNNIELSSLLGRDNLALRQRNMDSLKRISSQMERKLQTTIDKLNIESNTPNGIPAKTVLDEWVKTTISLEQSKARLTIMDKRKKEFADEYRKLAPLGAMLKKIERQITVAEQEYLEILHGLNLARLTQQNNELTSKLTTVDPPYLPLKANPSKRMVQVIIGFLAGFVVVLALLLTHFLLNKTLRQPDKAFKLIRIPLLGIYPLLNENKEFIKKANLKIMQQFLSRISIAKRPVMIGVISNQKGEGKSELIGIWKNELQKLHYSIEIKQFVKGKIINTDSRTDIVFIEFPPLDTLIHIPGQMPEMDNCIMVCRANRLWNKLDNELLDMFIKNTNSSPVLVLNGVTADYAEEFIGEVPKKRTVVRELIKKIAKMEFGNRKMLKRA